MDKHLQDIIFMNQHTFVKCPGLRMYVAVTQLNKAIALEPDELRPLCPETIWIYSKPIYNREGRNVCI